MPAALTCILTISLARERLAADPASIEARFSGMWQMAMQRARLVDRLLVVVAGRVVAVREVHGIADTEHYAIGGRSLTRVRFATAAASTEAGELIGRAWPSTRNPVQLRPTLEAFTEAQLAPWTKGARGRHGTHPGEADGIDGALVRSVQRTAHAARNVSDTAGASDSASAVLTPAGSGITTARVLGTLVHVDPDSKIVTVTMPAGFSAHIISATSAAATLPADADH